MKPHGTIAIIISLQHWKLSSTRVMCWSNWEQCSMLHLSEQISWQQSWCCGPTPVPVQMCNNLMRLEIVLDVSRWSFPSQNKASLLAIHSGQAHQNSQASEMSICSKLPLCRLWSAHSIFTLRTPAECVSLQQTVMHTPHYSIWDKLYCGFVQFAFLL